MEFSIAEIVAIGALILNVIVYFSRVPTRKDLNDLRTELRNEIRESRNEMNVRMNKLDESFTNHLMFMHGDSRQTPTQGEDK
jgi:hypothetical protein